MLAGYVRFKGVPLADLAVTGTGVALVAGVKPKLSAAAIAGFLGTVSPMMHDFWNVQDPNQQEMVHFTKNVALPGGALALMAVQEAWPVSVPMRRPGLLERVRNITCLARAGYPRRDSA